MRRLLSVVILCLLLSSCGGVPGSGTQPSPAPAPTVATPPATQSPDTSPTALPDLGADATLDATGLGPILLGISLAEARSRGWAEHEPFCDVWVSTPSLKSEGVELAFTPAETLVTITLTSSDYATSSGARVGMAYSKLQQLYGDDLRLETKNGSGGPFEVATVRTGDREIVFLRDWEEEGFTAETMISTISARPYTQDMFHGC